MLPEEPTEENVWRWLAEGRRRSRLMVTDHVRRAALPNETSRAVVDPSGLTDADWAERDSQQRAATSVR